MIQEESFGVVPCRKISGVWEIFLVKLHAGHWGLPKGHPNPNETPLESARRELLEETGLILESLITDQTFQETYSFNHRGVRIMKTVTYFLATVSGLETLQKEEVAEGLWLPLDAAKERITFHGCRAVIEQAMPYLNEYK